MEEKTLLESISAYVPDGILRRVAANPYAPLDGWQERTDATLLFADISGFTAMSETLARLGKEGAEELTRILNTYFSTMTDQVRAFGGFVVKFGGDAMTCQFPGGSEGLQRACACALEMQARMAAFEDVQTKAGPFTLRMKIGISGGPVLLLSVGSPQHGLEPVLVGRPLDRMVEAEHAARAGEIVVDAQPAPPPGLRWDERRGDFQRLAELTEPLTFTGSEERTGWTALTAFEERAIAQLMPFIPANVFQQITAGHRQFVGEHRRVVSVFVNFSGLDYTGDPAVGQKLQTYFVRMQDIIHQYGGRLNRLITGDKGSLLHLIFGAPIAHEDNEQRAVRCALRMQQHVQEDEDLAFIDEQRIGIASGHVFAGNVGSERRQEYTVMGDVVNLSARLMQAAQPGQALIDGPTARRIGEAVRAEALPPIQVKGKRAPVPVWSIAESQDTARTWTQRSGRLPLVGRRQEVAQIRALLTRVAAGHGQALVINGEAGVGKSRLLQELITIAQDEGFEIYGGNCLSYGSQTPYLPWIDVFNAYFGLRRGEAETPEARIRAIEQHMVAIDPALRDWVPLMAQMLGLPAPDNALTSALGAQLRKQRLFDITLTLLRHRAAQGVPLLIVFEDLHWADAISLEMLTYVARNIGESALMLVGVHRPTLTLHDWQRYPHYTYLELGDLPAEDALDLVKVKLSLADLPEELQTLVVRGEAQVNPFFVEELINALIERGYLRPQEDGPGYVIAGDLTEVEIPGSVHTLVMSRIDRLDENAKLTVKVAAVIGRTFQQRTLHAIYPVEIASERLHRNLERLNTLDLTPLDKPAPDWAYIFKHIITQEVAYESLLYAHRRSLHHSIAQYLEQTHQANLEEYYELLAHHYVASGDRDKSWTYLVLAGDKARDRYANEAAIDHYTRALAIWPDHAQAHRVHESLGDVHQLISQYDRALEQYRSALNSPAMTEEQTEPDEHAAQIRRKIAKTWSLQGQYDEAMHYLALTQEALGEEAQTLEMAYIYNDMGWIATQRGEYDQGLAYCTRGLDIAAHLSKDPAAPLPVQDELWHTLGSLYIRMGDHQQAKVHFQKCIQARERRGELYEVGRSYINLAVVYWGQGEFDQAATYLQKSLRIFQKVGSAYGTAMCYNNLGVLYYTLGDYPRAIDNYEHSLAIRTEIGDIQGIADTYNNLGEVHHALEDFRQALHYLQKAAEMFTELGDKGTLVDAYKLLAQVELELDDMDAARAYGQRSLALAEETGNPENVGVVQRVLGHIARATGDGATSRRHLERSVEVLRDTSSQLELARSYYELGLTLRPADPAASRATLLEAAHIFETLALDKDAEKAYAALPAPDDPDA
jgi:predicted ATPase/class 3 adenylate cyclase